MITDSGGIQEETTVLDIPCFTLRENTERPSTLIENGGTNMLVMINNLYENILNGMNNEKCLNNSSYSYLTDGRVSERIKKIITKII